MKDNYLAMAITLKAQNHYQSNPTNVSTTIGHLMSITDKLVKLIENGYVSIDLA
jgi:hypothetical protein